MYLSSADLMQRNLDRRIEIAFPIENKDILKTIFKSVLKNSLKDNVNSRILLPNGNYVFNHPVYTQKIISVQDWLMEHNVHTTDKKIIRKIVH